MEAGDALFAQPTVQEREREEAIARLILAGMKAVGTSALNVGERDLALGLPFLESAAKKAGVPLLSANLTTSAGKLAFEPGRIVEAGGVKVGLLGLFAPARGGAAPAGLSFTDPVAAATAQAAALQAAGAELVVALVHGPNEIAVLVARVPGVDLVIPSHEGSSQQAYQPTGAQGFVAGAGQKGKQLSRFVLSLGGTRPFVDAGGAGRAAKEMGYLQTRIADARARLEKAPPEQQAAVAKVVEQLTARAAELSATAAVRLDPDRNSLQHDYLNLGKDVPDDPALLALQKKHEQKFPAREHH